MKKKHLEEIVLDLEEMVEGLVARVYELEHGGMVENHYHYHYPEYNAGSGEYYYPSHVWSNGTVTYTLNAGASATLNIPTFDDGDEPTGAAV